MKNALAVALMIAVAIGVGYAATVLPPQPYNQVIAFRLAPGDTLSITKTSLDPKTKKYATVVVYTVKSTRILEGYAALHGTEK